MLSIIRTLAVALILGHPRQMLRPCYDHATRPLSGRAALTTVFPCVCHAGLQSGFLVQIIRKNLVLPLEGMFDCISRTVDLDVLKKVGRNVAWHSNI